MENIRIINYNQMVYKAFKDILKVAREIIAHCKEEPLRQLLIRSNKEPI